MNVYDFDKTIYDGDSTLDFYKFALSRDLKLVKYWSKQAVACLSYAAGKIDLTGMKQQLYMFLQDIDTKKLVESFWDANIHKIFKYYLDQRAPDDIVISASPRFLVQEACERLGISRLIASEVDPKTGLYTGTNCKGEEKVRRFESEIHDTIDEFYSDSFDDFPMAKLAKKAYMIRNGEVLVWPMTTAG